MSTEQYAIPSHRRVNTLLRKTVPMLHDLNVPYDIVDVWVNEDEADEYEQALPSGVTVRRIQQGGRVGAVRNAMAQGYPPGTRLIEIDDDVSRVSIGWRGRRFTQVTPDQWRIILDYAWDVCERLGLGLWGPYPVHNHFFMRPNSTTDLRYCTGTLFGTILYGDDTELVTLDDKEDFERNIRHTIRDGGVLRLNWLAYLTNYYGEPGGMQSYRTPELVEEGAMRLAGMFPDHCRYAGRVGKNGNAEVKLIPGRPVTDPLPPPDLLR